MKSLPDFIKICEVGPRDGLQNEKVFLTIEQKLELIETAAEAGIKVIEIGSFVNPKAVPQMADTDQIAARLHRKAGVEYRGLIFNMQGLKRAEAAGISKAKITVSASRSHCLRNMNKTPEEAVKSFAELAEYAEQKKNSAVWRYINIFWLFYRWNCTIRTSGQYYFSAAKIRNSGNIIVRYDGDG